MAPFQLLLGQVAQIINLKVDRNKIQTEHDGNNLTGD